MPKNIPSREWIEKKFSEFGHINEKGCRIWTGPYRDINAVYKQAILYKGYDTFSVPRLAAYLYLGLDFNNQDILVCHKNDICEDSRCFNQEHLYLGDASSNQLDRYKGKCKAGLHDMNKHTTIMMGHRRCADCRNEYKNKWRQARREKGLRAT